MRHPRFSGIVYIDADWGFTPKLAPIEGHWELPYLDQVAEDGPGWQSAAQAIAWGRERAPRVIFRVHQRIHAYRYVESDGILIRLHAPASDDIVVYAAGEDPMSEIDDVRRWPGASSLREKSVAHAYGGTVWLVQLPPESEQGDRCGFTARWEAVIDGEQQVAEVAGPDWEEGEVSAIAWARERAPYVLLSTGPPNYGYLSAGETDPRGLDLARWRSLSEIRERFREDPPEPPGGRARWISVLPDESKQFPIEGVEQSEAE